MSKKINIRPTTSVYGTYRNISYKPWSAYAEFIDNSTQSYYDNEQRLKITKYWDGLNIEINCSSNTEIGDYIQIKDNAYGMDFHNFERAVVLDSKPKVKNRSEFGMGLKTSACWFGNKWSVESTQLNSGIKYKTMIDVDMLQKYKPEEIDVIETTCSKKEHGTTITIWNLNRNIVGRQLGKTKLQLKGMYKRDIATGDINIAYNGDFFDVEEVKVLEESLPNNECKLWRKDINFEIEYNGKGYNVCGFVGIRETGNSTSAGFTLLRNGRVVVGGIEDNYRPEEIFEKSNSYIYQRLFGELNLDGWPISQAKDAFDWYGGLEDNFIEKLKEVCKEYIFKAKYFRKRNENVADSLNKMFQSFEDSGVVVDSTVEEIIGNTESGYTSANGDKYDNETFLSEFEDSKQKFKFNFLYEDKRYQTVFIIKKSDDQINWLTIKKEDNIYIISWNINHTFFKQYTDNADAINAMKYMIFALALSEIDAKEININGKIDSATIRLKMNDILKKVKGDLNNG